jgi:hypothetical protein
MLAFSGVFVKGSVGDKLDKKRVPTNEKCWFTRVIYQKFPQISLMVLSLLSLSFKGRAGVGFLGDISRHFEPYYERVCIF